MHRKAVPDRATLGRETGIPYHRLNPWWQRRGKPNAADALTLARFFDVSQDYLINGGERMPFGRLDDLLRRVESLSSQDQAALEDYLRFLETRTDRAKP